MLIGGIVLGLVLGLLAGGNLTNLAYDPPAPDRPARRRGRPPVRDGDPAQRRRRRSSTRCALPLLARPFGLLLVGLWANRGYPGMGLAFVGILSNAAVIVVNGGYMPIWEPSLEPPASTPADVTPPSTRPAGRRSTPTSCSTWARSATSSRSRCRSSRTSSRSATCS